jgi:Gpi18-like mannosyltransferase
MRSLIQKTQALPKMITAIPAWFWKDILFPFFLLRFVLIICAWFAPYFLPNPTYQKYVNQGYFLSPNFWIDMWSRWDAKWFFSIVNQGYFVPQGYPNVTSNIPFFPLYPYLVKLTAGLFPAVLQKTSAELLIGLIISNAACLVALTVLYKLIKEHLFDVAAAQRTIILLLLFPTSFYMTSFYAEGLFLGLAICAFYAALKNKWAVAGLLAGLITITRFQGVVVVFALAWIYMEKRGWNFRQIRADCLWFASAPLTLFAYSYHLYRLTGNPLAFVDAEKAWSRAVPTSLNNLFLLFSANYSQVDTIDVIMFLAFLGLSVWVLIKFQSKAYGIFCLGSLAMPLVSLQLYSITRFVSCIFPVFILLGVYSKNRYLYYFLAATWFALLLLFWTGWQNYYWIE